jgi:hypothetical protein
MTFYDDVDNSRGSKFYGDLTNIDLREELHAWLFGRVDLIPQGRPFILRQLTDTKCVCWDISSGGSKTPNCKYCSGEGYYWTETEWTMWMAQGVAPIYKPGFLSNGQYPQAMLGYTDPNRGTCYCEYNVFSNYERYTLPTNPAPDKLYALKVNNDGSEHTPLVRVSKWKIMNVVPLHGDFGRIDFFELTLEKEVIA